MKKMVRCRNLTMLVFICIFFVTSSVNIYAANGNKQSLSSERLKQETKVTGKVIDQSGQPMSGVNILEQGTMNGVVTNLDGEYSINVSSEEAVLVFSFISYVNENVTVGKQREINVTLVEDVTALEEIVVVGYGVMKKTDVTGAMVSVSSEELTERPVSNAFEALQGRAAGVDITSNERPGELGSVLIRGARSITASNDPLYVVDGVPVMSSSSIETINPRDIESIDILKDASATAIYGSRGANGVILVTTKRGKEGKLDLNYSGTFTMSNIVDLMPAMSASDYITWRRWAYYNSAPDVYASGDSPTYDNDVTIFGGVGMDDAAYNNIMSGWVDGEWDGSQVINTDWTKYVTQTALTQEHTVSASGGTKDINAYVSFGYLDNKGTQKGQEYDRYTGKINLDIDPKKWFKMGARLTASWSVQEYGFSQTGQSSSSGPKSIYAAAKKIGNFALPYDEDGEIITTPGNMGGNGSVYTVINEWEKSQDQRQVARVLGSFYGTADFGEIAPVLNGLTFKVNFGPDYKNYRRGVYIDNSSAARLGSAGSYAYLKNSRDFSWTLDEQIDYNKVLGAHKISTTLLHTASAWNVESSSMSANNISKSSYLWNAMGSVDLTATESDASMSSGLTERQLESYMARFNYIFKEKYLLTATGRWDGASQLSDGHKWDFFPSMSFGWRLSQEDFIKSIPAITQLKVRFGVGTTGNSAVDPYATLGAISSVYLPFGTGGSNTLAYTTNEPYYMSDLNEMANEDLGWEKTTQYNLGIDYSLFNGRVYGAMDMYKSFTNDLIMKMSISSITGYSATYANIGKTKNKGIDLTLNVVPVMTKNLTWDFGVSGAYQQDEIVELSTGKNDDVSNKWFIGQPISVYYGYECDGLWQEEDADEMAKYTEEEFEAGMVKPVDQNGDYIIDDDDRVILGQKNPKFTLGINSAVNYKDFDLSFMMVGRLGRMREGGGQSQTGLYQQAEIDYWTPTNTDAEWQKPILSTSGGDSYSGLLGYQKASFIKMRNISLGYNISSKFCNKVGIGSGKLYVQAQNPFMVYSTIDYLDLDTGSSTFNRSWVLGVNVNF